MTQPAANASIQRFSQLYAALEQSPQSQRARLTFSHALNASGLHQVLRACFNELAPGDVLPEASVLAHGAAYWLTAAGYGLRQAHKATGAVVGDAYTDFFDLLLAGQALVSLEITEDSYQPELVAMLTASSDQALDRLRRVLERRMRAAGC